MGIKQFEEKVIFYIFDSTESTKEIRKQLANSLGFKSLKLKME